MATIKDVAREAGVSIATVSRVFNDSAVVSADTRKQVREVAARLNYWPNGVARALITSRTHTLGVLLPELHGEFFSSVIRGIDLAARQEKRHLLVSCSHADGNELIAAVRAMRGRIDGLVVMTPDVETTGALRESAGDVPIVLLDPGGGVDGYHTVSIANQDGAQAMTRHLLALGHRRIATVTGPERNADARERLSGYRAALAEGDVAPRADYEIAGDFTEPSGHRAVRALLDLDPRPTAVFVGNDHMAVGVMRALQEAGVSVPQDLAVTGFDDIEMARYLSPPLTTVRVDTSHLGELAVRLLVQPAPSLSDSGRPCLRHEVLPTAVIVRQSCGSRLAPDAPGRARSARPRAAAPPRRSG